MPSIQDQIQVLAPDKCPLCHKGIVAIELCRNSIQNSDGTTSIKKLQVFYKCPLRECQEAFIVNYQEIRDGNYDWSATLTEPKRPEEISFDKEIREISPQFIEIFTQANAAESYQLNQISGVGYRKSLEFLIKDYLISKNPTKTDEIKNKFLGKCIIEHITDAKIKSCAELATWIGNDETHYVRKWEDKDIKDLKRLIRLTQTWISSEIQTENYLNSMKP